MGFLERLVERRLRPILLPGERILLLSQGTLPDGGRVQLCGGTEALYVRSGPPDGLKGFRYTDIASLVGGPSLDIIFSDSATLTIDLDSGQRGRVIDFVAARLLELPSYELQTSVDGAPWRVAFRPWRPGVISKWVVDRPPGVKPGGPTEIRLLERAVAEIQASVNGTLGETDAVVVPVPEHDGTELLKGWAHYFELSDAGDMEWGEKADVHPATTMVFALIGETVAVADVGRWRERHPAILRYPLGDFQLHDIGAGRFSIELQGRSPHSAFLRLGTEDTAGYEWVRRVRAAKGGTTATPAD
ncbi:hypothetical protein [Glycomyces algeriensis]|uniref:Uncharacterized protein n=1 Tax=Glycomyces algeriensis TaxID=256037 RepID=A0A9W6GAT8_9ACTN|nr:hypothetical protein [Glycomyces algeriensis]MDA1364663.1 hypothetical protein [Glycomyces algeriensis]MDR7350702.1 hypothetical protein [Glycomyces algeriensis]GLI43412.1 hypothetical protein GALLR39Z86_32620 [Glycomyces algeriensis]